MNLWRRYLLKEGVKSFLVILGLLFGVYAVVDYTHHMGDFMRMTRVQPFEILIYFAHLFCREQLLLIPAALLLSTLKVLTSLKSHGELIALEGAGISKRSLATPFLLIGLGASLFSYVSMEFIAPRSLLFLDHFRGSYFSHRSHADDAPVKLITLQDKSKLFYQKSDLDQGYFFDVLWLPSSNEVWRMQRLKIQGRQPVGEQVDELVRLPDGHFEKRASYTMRAFPQLKWDQELSRKGTLPPSFRSLSDLLNGVLSEKLTTSERREWLSHFYSKATLPLLSLLILLIVIPPALRFSRESRPFPLFAGAFFSLASLYTFLTAGLILGENQVVAPVVATLVPFLAVAGLATFRFVRMS